jgi:hypothetical protein
MQLPPSALGLKPLKHSPHVAAPAEQETLFKFPHPVRRASSQTSTQALPLASVLKPLKQLPQVVEWVEQVALFTLAHPF